MQRATASQCAQILGRIKLKQAIRPHPPARASERALRLGTIFHHGIRRSGADGINIGRVAIKVNRDEARFGRRPFSNHPDRDSMCPQNVHQNGNGTDHMDGRNGRAGGSGETVITHRRSQPQRQQRQHERIGARRDANRIAHLQRGRQRLLKARPPEI